MRRLSSFLFVVAGGFTFFAAPPAMASEQLETDRAELAALQQADARLHAVGWALATGNAPFCTHAAPSIGLLMQDVAGYAKPDRMRAAAGFAGDIGVQAVAPGSPAEEAGIRANMAIFVLDSNILPDLPKPANGYERLARITELMEQALARDGAVSITWRESYFGAMTAETIRGVPVCPGRFEMQTGSKRARADGERVLIGTKFAGLTYSDEEFAAAVAHEYAHNLLGHRALLDDRDTFVRIVATERQADRMMPWLLANAGYDPAAALRFMNRWGPKHGGGLFRGSTHDSWKKRADFISSELPLVAASIEKRGAADWAKDFLK